jgi:hypothetical protein
MKPGRSVPEVAGSQLRESRGRAPDPDPHRGGSGIPWGTVLAVFLATRVAFFLVAGVTVNDIPPSQDMYRNFNCPDVHGRLLLDVYSRWDSEWYLLIAKYGYDSAEIYAHGPLYHEGDSAGFFPLYPLLIRALHGIVGDWVLTGILLSNLLYLAALFLLAALVRLDHSPKAARLAVVFLSIFPGAIFFGAVYSESLFLFLALAVLYASRKGWWWTLGPLGFCASLSRPLGLLLIVPAAWEQLRAAGRRPGTGALWLAGFPAGFAGWMIFCNRTFGDPFAFAARQTAWRGTLSGPWKAFVRYFQDPAFHSSHGSTIDFTVAVLALVGTALFVRKIRFSYSLLGLLMVVPPLCSTLWSYTRFTAVVFPLFIGLAAAAEEHPRVGAVYVSLAPVLAGLFMALFASWRWAG